eukprot:jgi/Mesvir1/8006/Mv02081-RA.3
MSMTGLVGRTNPLFSVNPTRSVVDNSSPYDNVLDFDGPSGGTFRDLSRTNNDSATFTAAADLVPFIGPLGAAPGRVFFPTVAQAASTASASGNVIQQFLTNASADVTVIYVYIAPPPPPSPPPPSPPPPSPPPPSPGPPPPSPPPPSPPPPSPPPPSPPPPSPPPPPPPCVDPSLDPTNCCAKLTFEEMQRIGLLEECCEVSLRKSGLTYSSVLPREWVDYCCPLPCGTSPVIPKTTPNQQEPAQCYQELYKSCCPLPVGENTDFTYANPKNPFCQPSIRSDPHFVAGNGLAYDFMGKAGETYCLYSDKTLHMNMHMIGVKSNPLRKATWMDTISIMYFPFYNITISAESPEGTPFTAAHGTITVNGKTMKSQKMSTMVRWHGLTVQRRKTRVFVSIESLVDLEIEVVRAAFWKGEDGPGQNYLNFKVVSLNATDNVHGVLGQTFRASFDRTEKDVAGKNGEGVIEGSMADYIASDILKADCRVSQFLGAKHSWSDAAVFEMGPLRSWVGEAGGDSNYAHDELME